MIRDQSASMHRATDGLQNVFYCRVISSLYQCQSAALAFTAAAAYTTCLWA